MTDILGRVSAVPSLDEIRAGYLRLWMRDHVAVRCTWCPMFIHFGRDEVVVLPSLDAQGMVHACGICEGCASRYANYVAITVAEFEVWRCSGRRPCQTVM